MSEQDRTYEIILAAGSARAAAPYGRRAVNVEPVSDLLFILEIPEFDEAGAKMWTEEDSGIKMLTYLGMRRYVEQIGCIVIVNPGEADIDASPEEDW